MVSREQSTQTKQGLSPYCNFSRRIIKNVFKFLAVLLLPLTLGIFTIVITFHQQKVAEQQWEEHRSDSRLERELDWNISKSNQEAQNIVVRDQYRDQVFVAYFKEMGDLLEKNQNGSFTSDGLMAAIARVKTLNTFRQLDGSRQVHIIRFLYEAELLTNTNESVALDISTAELTDIDFRKIGRLLHTGKVSLAGVFLKNCIINDTFLNFVNFSSTEVKYVNFSSASLCDVNFTLAYLYDVNFSTAYFERVNFTSAEFINVNFSSAEFINVNFSSAKFAYTRNYFYKAQMNYTIFTQCNCGEVDFSYANLEGSSFHSADLTNTNFSFANLKDVDFTNTTITDIQLQNALSIRNAKLPNGTVGRDKNLIKNGDANCNISLIDHWQIENGNIAVIISKEQRNKCQFSLQSIETGATMSQIIDFKSVWDLTIWKHSYIELRADMSDGLTIELSDINNNGKVHNSKIMNSTENSIKMSLDEYTQQLKIIIKFNARNKNHKNENIWCNNIQLLINYGR